MSPAAPDELLRRSAALVFVDDLDELLLDGADAHHLVDVLRLGPGETVVAADGHGGWRPCALRVEAGGGRPVRGRGRGTSPAPGKLAAGLLEATGPVASTAPPSPTVAVGFALTKGDRPEWTVQKLTELGVDRILPIVSARTVVRLDGGEAARRAERLRRVAREAAAQSRNPRLPDVRVPAALDAVLLELGREGSPVQLAEPGGGALSAATAGVLVGPEGGWQADELACGTGLVGLGPTVLRAETAAVVAGTLLTAVRAGTVRVP